jgi:hypothetical protein
MTKAGKSTLRCQRCECSIQSCRLPTQALHGCQQRSFEKQERMASRFYLLLGSELSLQSVCENRHNSGMQLDANARVFFNLKIRRSRCLSLESHQSDSSCWSLNGQSQTSQQLNAVTAIFVLCTRPWRLTNALNLEKSRLGFPLLSATTLANGIDSV